MRKPKYTVRYCIKHGPFIGLKWCGHRRHCHAEIVTREEYEKLAKGGNPQSVLPAPRAPKALEPAPVVGSLVKNVKDEIAKLDSDIKDLTERLEAAKTKREQFFSELKDILKK